MCADSRIDRFDVPYAPLFFYHVPKTGGLSFYVALRSAIFFANKYSDRLGALGHDTAVHRADEDVPHRRLYQESYAVLASHHAFGFHRKFRQRFLLTTIVRDPVGRVRSEYTYNSMRKQSAVDIGGFATSFRTEGNINRAVKQLAGQTRLDHPAPPGLHEQAIATLERHFHTYVTNRDISGLLAYYLSYYRLPNVVMDRINTTSPAYRLDVEPFRPEIEALNDQDQQLFEFVRQKPRLPVLAASSTRSHPTTVIVNETKNEEQSEVLVIGVDTALLAETIRNNQGNASGLVIPVGALMTG